MGQQANPLKKLLQKADTALKHFKRVKNDPVTPDITYSQTNIPNETLELKILQEEDVELQQLEQERKYPTGKLKIIRKEEILQAEDSQGNKHWIVPNNVPRDLTRYVHEQCHKGKENTLRKS